MKEQLLPRLEEKDVPQVRFLQPLNPGEMGEPLMLGHSRKYRGNHRSENKGKGIEAFFRSLWMKRYKKYWMKK